MSSPILRPVRVKILAVPLAAFLLWGCRGEPLAPSTGLKYTTQAIDQEPHNDVDLLFVVDNSEGMASKQQALIAAFPALMNALKVAPGGLPTLRVGVVSSNLGAGGSRLAECDQSDRGLLQGPRAGCASQPKGRFLISVDGGTRNNFDGDPAAAFACLAALGTGGCGFEQHLGAAQRALGSDQPLENEGFLRPGAILGLVILADEDDCSTRAATDLFEPSTSRYGAQGSFRCAEFGHVCASGPPPRTGGELTGCRSAEGAGKLTTVAEHVAFFKGLKAQPERVLVSVVAGPPAPYAVRVVNGQPQVAPSCTSASGPAGPGVRLKEFADGFGARGAFTSVCDGDLAPAMTRLGEGIVKQIGAACLAVAPVKLSGAPDCRISERAAGLGPETPVPQCSAGGPRPCWRLDKQAQCYSGLELKIDRGSTVALPGTVATALCRVCTDPKDVRCK
jgi:hypothetical protein